MTRSTRLETEVRRPARPAAAALAALLCAQVASAAAPPPKADKPAAAPAAEAAAPGTAPASDAPQAADPKAIFADAQKDYQLGRFTEAIPKYERVFELTSHPSLLFNIAQCHRQLGNWERAAFFYDRYLSTAAAPIPNEDTARGLLAEVTKKRDEETARKLALDQEQEQARLRAQAETARPITSRWWFWTIIGGVVVAGTATAIGVAASQPPARPQTSLGEIRF